MDGWERHYDASNKWWYRYNPATGQSEWEDAFDTVVDEAPGSIELNTSKRKKRKKKNAGDPSFPTNEDGVVERRRGGNSVEDMEDGTTLMEDIDRIYAETEGDIVCYYRCIFLTACLFEGPLVILEALVRSMIFFVMGIIYIILAILREQERDYWYTHAKKCMRETLLCLATAFTFMIPFTGCCVYRAYRSDEAEWDLAPMPTVLGWVDTRRFFTFCLGGGSMAVRGRADFIDDDDYELESGAEDQERRSQGEQRQSLLYERAFDIHMRSSRDSWKGGIPFAPRKVSRSLANVMYGDEDSLLDVESQMLGSLVGAPPSSPPP
jgi:hypothetical protein